ncbi:hypothetical protein E2C01_088551 [Portunus trituberculatus]|uniref:Uncharacterized protein n=1 Tax=Portunus trituberculatus TaxID=210409 RepID=A0A5B7JFQ9_PORTR|nr:hypothetical protein [Portunus trituberculatus]
MPGQVTQAHLAIGTPCILAPTGLPERGHGATAHFPMLHHAHLALTDVSLGEREGEKVKGVNVLSFLG